MSATTQYTTLVLSQEFNSAGFTVIHCVSKLVQVCMNEGYTTILEQVLTHTHTHTHTAYPVLTRSCSWSSRCRLGVGSVCDERVVPEHGHPDAAWLGSATVHPHHIPKTPLSSIESWTRSGSRHYQRQPARCQHRRATHLTLFTLTHTHIHASTRTRLLERQS